jgi:hypothetical protein
VQSTVIKTQFRANGLFYAPTYLALRTMVRSNEFEGLSKARQEKKRKGDEVETFSNELEREKVWLKNRLSASLSSLWGFESGIDGMWRSQGEDGDEEGEDGEEAGGDG